MIPALRRAFNAAWTRGTLPGLPRHPRGQRVGVGVGFPIAETPCFFPRALLDELAAAGEAAHPPVAAAARPRAPPSAWCRSASAGRAAKTRRRFCRWISASCASPTAGFEPRLVELQAFPSLYGFQLALADAYRAGVRPARRARHIPRRPRCGRSTPPSSATPSSAGHDPAEVVLMEIEPARQKTRPDFAMTEQFWGVRAVDTADVTRTGGTSSTGATDASPDPPRLQPRHP